MGEVYLAEHPHLPRSDALKVLPPQLTSDDEFRLRFLREADSAAALRHGHIVPVYDRGESNGHLWISTQYVKGTDAATLLRTQYPSGIPKAVVWEIIFAVADALDYGHARGVLHGDVKPANILLSDGTNPRRIMLADFGISWALGGGDGLTEADTFVGTVDYCAPEQLQGASLDGTADQYALGCTAFHLLTGSSPYQAPSTAVVIAAHLSAPPPLISERRADLVSLDGVFTKVLAKEPSERYATCGDFAAALISLLDGEGDDTGDFHDGTTQPCGSAAATDNSKKPRNRRAGLLSVIASIVGVALVAVAAFLFSKPGHDSGPPTSENRNPSPGSAVAIRHRRVGGVDPIRGRHSATDLRQALHRPWCPPVDGVRRQFRRPSTPEVGGEHRPRQRRRRVGRRSGHRDR